MGRRHVSGKAGSDDIDMSSVQLDVDKWAPEFFTLFDHKCRFTTTNSFEADVGKINHHPLSSTAYRLPLRKGQVVETELDKMLADDII